MARVDALCKLYQEAYLDGMAESQANLKRLVRLAKERGFGKSAKALLPNLRPEEFKTVAWNISSVLLDEDLEQLGISLNDRGKPSR